jgi:flagellar motor switch protein FliM
MKESNLKLAQKEIDDALEAVDEIVNVLDNEDEKSLLKEKFNLLSSKLEELENILKEEGIL